MEITLEGTRFGLWLLLLFNGCFMLMSVVFVILALTSFEKYFSISAAREKFFWVPAMFSGVLFCAGWEIVVVTQLFDFTFQYRDRCVALLIISGVSLTLFSSSALTSPVRTITKCASFLSAMLFLFIFILSLVGLIDLLYFWTVGGAVPGLFASFLHLETWGMRGFGLLFGGTMLASAFALATASLAPVDIQHGNSRFSARFKGGSPALRKASKITSSAACLLAALFGFAIFFDVVSAFVDLIRNAEGFQFMWALILFATSVLAYSAATEKEWRLLRWVLSISICLVLVTAAIQFRSPTSLQVAIRTISDFEQAVSAVFEAGEFYIGLAVLLIVFGGGAIFALFSDEYWLAAVLLCIVGFFVALVDDWEAPMTDAWQAVIKLLH